jgi:hypothetical protein
MYQRNAPADILILWDPATRLRVSGVVTTVRYLRHIRVLLQMTGQIVYKIVLTDLHIGLDCLLPDARA